MRSIAILICFSVFCLPYLSAQEDDSQSKTTFSGVSFGYGWSKMATNQAEYFDEKYTGTPATTFSFPVEFRTSDKSGIQLEFSFMQLGFGLLEKTQTTDYFSRDKVDARIRYLSIPISLKFDLPIESSKFDFYLSPGLTFAYAWKSRFVSNSQSKTKTASENSRGVVKVSLDKIPFSDRTDVGLHVGLGISHPTKTGKFFFETRFYQGILNLDRNVEVEIDDPEEVLPKSHNRQLNFSLGYLHAF